MDHLQTEARNPASTNLDELTAIEFVRLMNTEDCRVITAVATQAEAIARAIDLIAERIGKGGRLIYVGAGTSGRLGVLDASECPPTFNSPPEQVVGVIAGGPAALTRAVEGAEDHPEYAEQDLQALQLGARDVVVGIATSGRTPYVLGAVDYARRQAAATIGLACNPDSELATAVDLAITPVVGPEVLSGSTRLKAGTATKLVLNMLSTGTMVRMGKTFGNLMVDLRATNSKLRARANRIVRLLTGLSPDEADELLRTCDGELKTALVVNQAGVGPAEARSRLHAGGGQVRSALGSACRTAGPAGPAQPAADLYLGIDGGGTHTVALLAAPSPTGGLPPTGGWSLLGRGEAGPSNLHAVGVGQALHGLNQAVDRAFAAAGFPRTPVAAACLGLAGAGRADDQAAVRAWTERVQLAQRVDVTSDAALLLAAGTPDAWGLALVAGTGSMAYGRTPDGRSARAGGWGYLLGDEGSGYALALSGLRAVARAADGRGPATGLTQQFLTRLGLNRPPELIPTVYQGSWDRAALAGLAPLVLEAAEAHDTVAAALVAEAAGELAGAAAAVARELAIETSPLPLALAGGVLLASEGYRRRVLQMLETLSVHANPVAVVREPAVGAVRLALLAARGGRSW
jgi:N-acetylmuramic acid 6-phosphate etherase